MNKNYLGILFAAIILLSMSAVYASIGVGSWVDNNDAVLNINTGQTAEFRYGVTAVSLYDGVVGKYSIMLYREGVSTPLVKYVDNKATVGNGAIGRFNVTPANYSNVAGNYYILIDSIDKFSSDSFRLNLNVGAQNNTNNTNTTNSSASVVCMAVPSNGYSPLNVTLTALVSGTSQPYNYQWDYNDGQSSTVQSANQNSISATHLYNIGTFNPTIKVTDSNNNIVTANCSTNGISVMAPVLDIQNLNCFARVTDGKNQSCSVFVKSNNGQIAGNVDVSIYYVNGTLFGSCKTDRLSGACEVEAPVYGVGTYTVYATASASGYVSDNDTQPRFTFDVYAQRYNVINLGTYNDSNFFYPSDTFYRGQPLYVKFQVYDPVNNVFVTNDIVTAAALVSLPGGRADLSRITYNGNWYYYSLTAIPLTHDFLGGSNVFAFAFNFTGLTSGQAQVHLTILNNKPAINNIADVYVRVGDSYSLFLNNYGSDLEDKTLAWNIQSNPSLFLAAINPGNVLLITGLNVGAESLKLRGYDLDNDYAETNVTVHVIPAVVLNNLTASCSILQNNGTIPFTAQFNSQVANGVGTYSYEWSFGDGNVVDINLGSTSHTYGNSGTYGVSLLVTDSANNIAVANCGQVIVNNSVVPPQNVTLNVSCSAMPDSGNSPLNVTLISTVSNGNGPYSFTYDYGLGFTSTSQNNIANQIYTSAGIYAPTVNVIDSTGNVGSASCGVVTVANVIQPNTTLNVACITLPNVGTAPLNASVTSIINNGVGPYNIAFDFGNGVLTNILTNSLFSTQYTTYDLSGTYYPSISVTDSNGYTGSASCGFVLVNNANNTNITFPVANAGGPYTGYVNEALTFDASASVGNIVDYRWDFGDGTGIVDTSSPVIQHTYSKINIYDVKLIVFDVNGYVVDAKTTATIIERTSSQAVVARDVPDKGIIVKSLLLYGTYGEILKPNDDLTVQMNLKNDWNTKLKNVRVIASIPELGLESRAALFDMSRGSESSQAVTLPLYDVAPGTYYVRISIDNDDGPDQVRRVKYREIVVKK